ncbi:hypothetical protein ATO6_12325 [Oceanicola sp. 22II-s10i]|uniref:hypothetical protein n=1 Tax=Oceanicola sp. 22II-s10i TaxID=1317116 RepID=UPI000B527A34|nr:hypothetical protein [Oceanicola sp. 22II-s10i]OWU84472.1 hypothetical protein ATO6_12325 [Oceanicola sp. 22II-s10i]
MAPEYLTRSDTATLTERELFQRFLDAPVRTGTVSHLVAPAISDETAEYKFFGYHGFDSVLPDELGDQIIGELRRCDDPGYELETLVIDVECILEHL